LLSGCAATGGQHIVHVDENGDPVDETHYLLTDGDAADEYHSTIDKIPEPLPAGVAYPASLPADFLPTDGVLEAGAARNVAWYTWLCAWESEYLDARALPDDKRQAVAEAEIAKWPDMDFYAHVVVDDTKSWESSVLKPMQLGDPSGVDGEHNLMCPIYPTVADG